MGYTASDTSGNITSVFPVAGSGGSGGPAGSRAILDLGGFYSTSTDTTYWTTAIAQLNDNGAAASTFMHQLPKVAYPFKVTGWQLQQYVGNGVQRFQICKNRTGSAIAYIDVPNAGNATVTGFPGNSFSGQLTGGPYTFAVGDSISAVIAMGSGASTNVRLQLTIEWL